MCWVKFLVANWKLFVPLPRAMEASTIRPSVPEANVAAAVAGDVMVGVAVALVDALVQWPRLSVENQVQIWPFFRSCSCNHRPRIGGPATGCPVPLPGDDGDDDDGCGGSSGPVPLRTPTGPYRAVRAIFPHHRLRLFLIHYVLILPSPSLTPASSVIWSRKNRREKCHQTTSANSLACGKIFAYYQRDVLAFSVTPSRIFCWSMFNLIFLQTV